MTDLVLRPESTKTITSAREAEQQRLKKGKKMEASYEVVCDSNSEAGMSDPDEEAVNGEEIRRAMESFRFSQSVRTGIAGLAFAMSVVGIWGDGF